MRTMSTTTVYLFTGYDFTTDMPTTSKRWATQEWIERNHLAKAPNTAVKVQEQILEEGGLTPHGFDPYSKINSGPYMS